MTTWWYKQKTQSFFITSIVAYRSFGISQYLHYYHNMDNNKIIDEIAFPENFGTKLISSQLIQSEALWILITSLPSHRHIFCNHPRIWKNKCRLWRGADHNCNWCIHLFVTLSICVYKPCLHTCDSSACSYRSLCCDFLELAGSVNMDTIILHLFSSDG